MQSSINEKVFPKGTFAPGDAIVNVFSAGAMPLNLMSAMSVMTASLKFNEKTEGRPPVMTKFRSEATVFPNFFQICYVRVYRAPPVIIAKTPAKPRPAETPAIMAVLPGAPLP